MFVIKHRKIFYTITSFLIILIILAVASFGLRFAIDFTGGVSAQITYESERPPQKQIEKRLKEAGLEKYKLNSLGESSYILRARNFTEKEQIIEAFAVEEKDFDQHFSSISPLIGKELSNKAQVAVGVAILSIIIFIAIAFRKAAALTKIEKTKGVSSFKYGLIAILALLHDIAIPIGIFTLLSYFVGAEVDILLITALLTIMGYSVNDTIVVFDRIRENIEHNKEEHRDEDFELTVGKSLSQVYPRSINTSVTTAVVLISLYFLGAQSTENFALVLFAGVIAGTYSSIFLAAPLLVTFEQRKNNNKK